jgi:hypothetical protein
VLDGVLSSGVSHPSPRSPLRIIHKTSGRYNAQMGCAASTSTCGLGTSTTYLEAAVIVMDEFGYDSFYLSETDLFRPTVRSY